MGFLRRAGFQKYSFSSAATIEEKKNTLQMKSRKQPKISRIHTNPFPPTPPASGRGG
jgi:hypothetical protein